MFGPVEASPRQRTNYAIEAGLAIHQLSELARKAKATILFDYELIKSVTVNPVIGNYNLKQALQLMLKGTPLIGTINRHGIVKISYRENEPIKGEEMNLNRSRRAVLLGTATSFLFAGSAATIAQDSATEDESVFEEIVDSGIRASLKTANDRKRGAANFIDGIAAEDLGKFPDQNVAESLQRVTGVTINRVAGEGSEITVRGFGPEFNIVRINDRTLATVTEERNFDFQILPSELIIGADVAKTPTANMWGGSIGANINLRTARPLDNPGFNMSLSAQGRYQDLAESFDPKFSGVFSNTFADDTFGVLLGIAYEDRLTRTDESRNGEGNANGFLLFDGPVNGGDSESRQFRVPARSGQSFTEDNRERVAI
ncbi:MAG: TonB-dependent receptor plug domain-containing protein, partial [Kordiimonadaceae bacterium]|nr:TonB-dependent receptor plug domain-containing protein [Kordiimonadaceae bacterium]